MNGSLAIARLPDERLQSLAWQAVLKGMANRGETVFTKSSTATTSRLMSARQRWFRLPKASPAARSPPRRWSNSANCRRWINRRSARLLDQAKAPQFRPLDGGDQRTHHAGGKRSGKIARSQGAEAIEHFFKSSKPNPEAVSRWALQLPASAERRPHSARQSARGSTRISCRVPNGPAHCPQVGTGIRRWPSWQSPPAPPPPAMRRSAEITDPAIQAELREWLQNQPQTK